MSFINNQIKLSISTMIEWYDAMLYIAFIPYLMHAYLPHEGQKKALLILFLGFAAGNLVRPLGAIVFGMIGDKIGKIFTYNLSIVTMCIATILIGLIPSYNSIGILAPICLLIIRLIQGLSMGAQFGTLLAINGEFHQKGRKIGFANNLCQSISFLGHSFALIAALIVSYFNFGFNSNVWRYPFVLVTVLLIYHLIIGRHITFEQSPMQKKSLLPELMILFTRYKRVMICNIMMSFCVGGIFAILAFYSIPFMKFYLHLNYADTSIYSLIFFWIIIILSPIFGKVFDHADRALVYTFLVATIGISLLFIPYLQSNKLHFITYFIIIAVLLSSIRGAVLPQLSQGLNIGCSCFAINLSFTLGITLAAFIPSLLVTLSVISLLSIPLTILTLTIILLLAFLLLPREVEKQKTYSPKYYAIKLKDNTL